MPALLAACVGCTGPACISILPPYRCQSVAPLFWLPAMMQWRANHPYLPTPVHHIQLRMRSKYRVFVSFCYLLAGSTAAPQGSPHLLPHYTVFPPLHHSSGTRTHLRMHRQLLVLSSCSPSHPHMCITTGPARAACDSSLLARTHACILAHTALQINVPSTGLNWPSLGTLQKESRQQQASTANTIRKSTGKRSGNKVYRAMQGKVWLK